MGSMIREPLPLTEAELKGPITKATYFRRALHFHRTVLGGRDSPVIRLGSDEFDTWHEYFERHLGWVPVVFQMMVDRKDAAPLGFGVPTQWPQSFDPTFVEDPHWVPPQATRRQPTSRKYHDTLEELRARHGSTWGIQQMDRRRPAHRDYKPLTDDDLRRIYGKRHDEPDKSDEPIPF
jgi:hypothetical protein